MLDAIVASSVADDLFLPHAQQQAVLLFAIARGRHGRRWVGRRFAIS